MGKKTYVKMRLFLWIISNINCILLICIVFLTFIASLLLLYCYPLYAILSLMNIMINLYIGEMLKSLIEKERWTWLEVPNSGPSLTVSSSSWLSRRPRTALRFWAFERTRHGREVGVEHWRRCRGVHFQRALARKQKEKCKSRIARPERDLRASAATSKHAESDGRRDRRLRPSHTLRGKNYEEKRIKRLHRQLLKRVTLATAPQNDKCANKRMKSIINGYSEVFPSLATLLIKGIFPSEKFRREPVVEAAGPFPAQHPKAALLLPPRAMAARPRSGPRLSLLHTCSTRPRGTCSLSSTHIPDNLLTRMRHESNLFIFLYL